MRLFGNEKLEEIELHEGEPFFLLRARENLSVPALLLICLLYGDYAMSDVITRFKAWRKSGSNRKFWREADDA